LWFDRQGFLRKSISLAPESHAFMKSGPSPTFGRTLARLLPAVLLLLAGCERPAPIAAQDARDRESPLIRRALEREQIGDLDGAIQAYEEVLLESPKLISAHFHLALLLQDIRKDYMGAIYHYRQYERLRPDSEKKALLRERTRVCQQLLVAQLLKTGDVAISQKQFELVGAIDKLNKQLSVVEGEKGTLAEQKAELARLLSEQKSETERLRRLLDRINPTTGEEPRPRSALPRLDPGAASLLPTPGTATPPSITRTPVEPESSPKSNPVAHPAPAPEPAPLSEEAPKALEPPPVTTTTVPPPPMSPSGTYVVQPGDSFYRIAERFYGDSEQWKKIRDANKDRLSPGNQLRSGQHIVIP
jgi:LysM repeat protein